MSFSRNQRKSAIGVESNNLHLESLKNNMPALDTSFDFEIKNTIEAIVGDIDVRVDIRFLPIAMYENTSSKVAIIGMQAMLGRIGFELQQEIKESLERKLKEANKKNSKTK